MNKEIGLYPGSFRPFHNEHLARVELILKQFSNMQLVVAVSSRCPKEGGDQICGLAVVGMVSQVVEAEGIKDRVTVRMVDSLLALDFLTKNGISKVMTGSKATIFGLVDLKSRGLWNGEIIELDNSGIHSTDIRKMIASGDGNWREHIHPTIQQYLVGLSF